MISENYIHYIVPNQVFFYRIGKSKTIRNLEYNTV